MCVWLKQKLISIWSLFWICGKFVSPLKFKASTAARAELSSPASIHIYMLCIGVKEHIKFSNFDFSLYASLCRPDSHAVCVTRSLCGRPTSSSTSVCTQGKNPMSVRSAGMALGSSPTTSNVHIVVLTASLFEEHWQPLFLLFLLPDFWPWLDLWIWC